MATIYQHDASGYYLYALEHSRGPIPHNCVIAAPKLKDGFIPHWNSEKWEQIENHKGRKGWLNGQAHIIAEYGPLPEGWSDTAPEPSLAEALTAKLAEVINKYSAAFISVEAVYPAAEREGWPIQEAEARVLMIDSQAETPVLSALVQFRARGETVADLATKVLANAGQWRMVYAYLTGQQQRMYGEVTALAEQPNVTGAEILAYPVAYQLPEGL